METKEFPSVTMEDPFTEGKKSKKVSKMKNNTIVGLHKVLAKMYPPKMVHQTIAEIAHQTSVGSQNLEVLRQGNLQPPTKLLKEGVNVNTRPIINRSAL